MAAAAVAVAASTRAVGRAARAALRLIRPHNCVGGAIAAALGAYVAGGSGAFGSEAMRAMLAVALGVAVGNIANDWRDAALDAIAKPHRPLPSGAITPRTALWLGATLGGIALLLAATLGFLPLLFALVFISLGVLYSFALKSTVLLGNAVVALVSASPVPFGALVAGGIAPVVMVVTVMVFLFVFAREILKTIADEQGDRRAGLRTIATVYGSARAFRAFYLATAVVMIATAGAAWWASDTLVYLAAAVLFIIVPTGATLVLLARTRTDAMLERALRVTKAVWFTGMVAMALLR